MSLVYVDVGICRYVERYAGYWLQHHETRREDRAVAVVFVINRQFVVAAHLDGALLVRNAQGVVSVQSVCVD